MRFNNATGGIDENGVIVPGEAANSKPNQSYAPGKAKKGTTQSLVGVPATPVNPPGNGGSSYKPLGYTYFIPFDRVDGASYYNLYESTSASGGSLSYSGNGPSAPIYPSSAGYKYYRYAACNAAAQCSGLSPWRRIVVYTTSGYVNNLAISPLNVGLGESYTVSWTPAGGAVDGAVYTVYERHNGGGESVVFSVTRQTWQESSYAFSTSKQAGGTYRYRVQVCNPIVPCGSAVTINQTVIAPNTNPVANPDSVVLTQDTTTYINVLANDTDAEGHSLMPSLYGSLSHGSASIFGSAVRYTPDAGYKGIDSFSYRAQDSQGLYSSAARVDVTINAAAIPAFLPVDSTQNSVTAAITSDDIGTIKGHANISGGAANYSVPIALPPGRVGMQPSVSLNYSSNGGNGLMGQGWSLVAGGGISRCGAIYAIDQRRDAVQYTHTDKLCLNGQRLKLKSGSYGASSSTYHPQTSPTTLVTLNGDWHSTVSSFTVAHGNGHTQYYGNTPDSIVLPGAAGNSVHSWLLNETQDLHGNTIEYTYDNTTNVGMNYLSDIVYTGNATLSGDRKVEFDYEDRADRSVNYRGGFRTLRTRRLSTITTSVAGATVHRYNLGYQPNNNRKSTLETLEQCFGGNSRCLPATTFDVEGLASTVFGGRSKSDAADFIGSNRDAYTSQLSVASDYDGDGQNDLVINGLTGTHALIRSTRYNQDYPISGLFSAKAQWDDNYAKIINGGQMDFNLDGKIDFVGVNNVNQRVGKLGFASFNEDQTMNTQVTSIDFACSNETFERSGEFYKKDCSTYIIDINGDGKMDMLVSQANGATTHWVAYINTHDGKTNMHLPSFSLASGVLPSSLMETPMQVMDVDGDGYDDLICTVTGGPAGGTQYQSVIPISLDYNPASKTVTYTDRLEFLVSKQSNASANLFIDINQDGLVDNLYAEYNANQTIANNTVIYRLNTGKSFAAAHTVAQVDLGATRYFDAESTQRDLAAYIQMLDYDRDGVMDIVFPKTKVAAGSCTASDCAATEVEYDLFDWHWYKGSIDGAGLVSFASGKTTGIIAPASDLNFTDFNGDGYVDAITRLGRFDSTHAMSGSYGVAGIYVYANQNAETDLVKNITDGMGLQTKFDYDTLSDDTITNSKRLYNSNFTSQFPYVHFATTDTVVRAMHTSNGYASNGLNTTQFYYSQARFHKQGRGFQGFGYIEEVKEVVEEAGDDRVGISVQTTYNQTYPHAGMIEQQFTYVKGQTDDNYLSKTTNSEFTTTNGAIAVVPYAQLSASQSKALDGTVKTTTFSEKTLNDLGHPTQSKSTVCDGGNMASRSCGNAPWSKETTTDITRYKTSGVIEKPEVSTTTAIVSYFDALGRTHADLKVTKELLYNSDWTVQSVTTTDGTNTGDQYQTAPTLTQTFLYYTSGNAKGQLKRVTSGTAKASNSTTGVNGVRWNETKYTSDGYFVQTTHNSLWGSTVAASKQSINPHTGQVLNIWDANNNLVTNGYDDFNRLHTVQTAGVPTVYSVIKGCISTVCEDTGSSVETYYTMTQQAGSPTVYKFIDSVGRTLREKTIGFDGTAIQSWTRYNRKGEVTSQVSPAGVVTFADFDELGRPVSKTVSFDPQEYTVEHTYAGLTTGMVITSNGSKDSGAQRSITRTVNSAGQLMTSLDEMGQSTKYRYSAAGLPTIIQGPTGIKTTAYYNALGHKTKMTDPNQGSMVFGYNELGELRSQLDANGTTTIFYYDQLGRTVERRSTKAGESTAYWKFDQNDRRGTLSEEYLASGSAFAKSYSYDIKGRMTQATTTIDSSNSYTQNFAFDSKFGRLIGMRHPDGTSVYYGYNNAGFPTTESDNPNGSGVLRTIRGIDHNGLLTKVNYRNNLTTTTGRKNAGAITSICTSVTGQACNLSSNAQFIEYSEYDSFGNLGKRDNHSQAVKEVFHYDELDRLTKAEKTSTLYTNIITTDYGYDGSGNLSKKSDFSTQSGNAYKYNGSGPNAVSQVALTDKALGITAAGRIMDFNYDNNGNLTHKTVKLSGAEQFNAATYRTIEYNSNNKPIKITNQNGTVTEFNYGSDGLRYKQRTGNKTTHYVAGGSYEVDIQYSEKTSRAYIGDYAIMTRSTASGIFGLQYIHRDRLGSVDTITNGNTLATLSTVGIMQVEQRSYNAFGKARTATGAREADGTEGSGLLPNAPVTPRGFTNHEHLGGSGLIHMNGRAYDPELGRFLSVDPIISMPENGQSLNPYSYVMNNPLKYTDPSGYVGEKPEEPKEEEAEEEEKPEPTLPGATSITYKQNASQVLSNSGRPIGNYASGKATTGSTTTPTPSTQEVLDSVGKTIAAVDSFLASLEPVDEGPGALESAIPIWGSIQLAKNDFKKGNYGWGIFNSVMAVSDVFLVKALVVGVGKIAAGTAFKKGSHTWGATRSWLGRTGQAAKGQEVHHWFLHRNQGLGKYVPDFIKNQPWNLMPMRSRIFHQSIHGAKPNPFNLAGKLYYGTPQWAKSFAIYGAGRTANGVLNN